MKKTIIFIITMFLFWASVLSVKSALIDGNIIYYTMDDTNITGNNVHTEIGSNNGTLTNVISGVSGIINEGVAFDGFGDTLVSISNSGIEGDDDFTLNCWFYDNRTIDTAENYVFYGVGNDDDACALGYLTHNTGANDDKFYGHLRGGCAGGSGDFSSTEYIPYNDWFMGTWVHNSSADDWYIYINGVINDTYNLGTDIILNTHPLWIGASDDAITWNSFNGTIDECGLWNVTKPSSEILELYNGGIGLQYPFSVGGGDITPPTITNITQVPINITVLNSLIDVFVNGTVLDETALNITTPYLNLTLNNITIFVNGIVYPMNYILPYFNYTGSLYKFEIDENSFLPATYNFNESIMETTPHQNDTLDGLNRFLKIRFYNVTASKKANFYEMMDLSVINDTNVDYYYCNNDYLSGNPIGHNNCTLFASRNTNIFNHSHGEGFSRHNILPMGIDTDTGTINGILVTETSYILIRGLVGGHRYFYINKSLDITSQTSTNNGNTWTNLTNTTIDAHIHQFVGNSSENIIYNICAYDEAENKGCSALFQDAIDFPILPPNAVNILNPVDNIYNITIIINHSVSFSASGQSITGYLYEYKKVGSSLWIEIKDNNYPNTDYVWDISTFLNDDYNIRITVTDSLNLTSVTVSQVFTIDNPLSVTDQLITISNEKLTIIGEAVEMIFWGLIIIIFLVLGLTTSYLFWGVSGLVFWIQAILNTLSGTFAENLAVNIFYILIGFMLMFAGVIMEVGKSAKKDTKKNMYDNFYDV